MFSTRSNQLPAQRILKTPPDAEHNLLLEPTFLKNHLIHLAWLEPFGVSVGVPQEDPLFISSYDIAGKPIVTWVCLQSASDLNTLLPLLRCKVVGGGGRFEETCGCIMARQNDEQRCFHKGLNCCVQSPGTVNSLAPSLIIGGWWTLRS